MTPRREGSNSGVRLDAFLKDAGILKRRSLAQTFCEAGAVSVNGKNAKSGKHVHEGDRIRLDTWNRCLEVLICSIPRKGGIGSEECYQILQQRKKS